MVTLRRVTTSIKAGRQKERREEGETPWNEVHRVKNEFSLDIRRNGEIPLFMAIFIIISQSVNDTESE